MTKPERSAKRGKEPRKNDLKEARPLLQAIFLGLLLATGLVAAAAMANPAFEPQQTPELRDTTKPYVPAPASEPASRKVSPTTSRETF